MSNYTPETSNLNSDEEILSDGTRLTEWEDRVAMGFIPNGSLEDLASWTGARQRLVDLLRLPGFNGPLLDIHIVAMDSPEKELLQILRQKEPPKFAARDYPKPTVDSVSKLTPEQVKGYYLVATATSSGHASVGDIYTSIWFVFKPGSQRGKRQPDVLRYVLAPLTDEAAFDLLIGRSIAIGRRLMGRALAHPIQGGGVSSSHSDHRSNKRDFHRMKENDKLGQSPSEE